VLDSFEDINSAINRLGSNLQEIKQVNSLKNQLATHLAKDNYFVDIILIGSRLISGYNSKD